MKMRLLLSIWIGFMLFSQLAAQNKYIIIVHKSVPEESLNRANVENIFLGKKSRWSDGTKVVPVTLNQGEIHELFIQEVIRKSTNAYMNYWRKMIFTGKGVMPLSLPDEQKVVEYIGHTEGAIGYISSSSLPEGNQDIRVLSLTD